MINITYSVTETVKLTQGRSLPELPPLEDIKKFKETFYRYYIEVPLEVLPRSLYRDLVVNSSFNIKII